MDPTGIDDRNRRTFLARASQIAATAMLGFARPAAAEAPLETTRIRIAEGPYLCFAPQYLAEELLRLEGFTDIEYVPSSLTFEYPADFSQSGTPSVVAAVDAGYRVVALSGVHAGCWELFANDRVREIRDLKRKRVAVMAIGGVDYLWISSMSAYLGMDPRTDIDWVVSKSLAESKRLFVEGKADAFLAFPPQPQELRLLKMGHVILNTTEDPPWSQYFCCMIVTHRRFVERHPNATKRALRAILKATDICARDPETAARLLVAKGFEPRFEIGLEVLKGLPYAAWREFNPEDTLRFHALRLHEVGMAKSTPQEIISAGTDWRFLNQLRRELKT
jgi:NitT/TauT family transport system substrate-binding protein